MTGSVTGWQDYLKIRDVGAYTADDLHIIAMLGETPEPDVCAVFGCGRVLSLQERLYGKTCINHQKRATADPVKYLNL